MSDERVRITGRQLPLDEIGSRPCCLLSTQQGVTLPIPILDHLLRAAGPESVIDTGDLQHKLGASGFWDYWLFKTEQSGILYTRRGGFIDLGHLRDHIDLTLDYYREVKNALEWNRRSFSPGRNDKVSVRILRDIPRERHVAVAQSMAFDESIFHEIDTYWNPTLNLTPWGPVLPILVEHKSAFSPEDLVSNFLGVVIGGKAIRRLLDPVDPESRGMRFNAGATLELTLLLDSQGLDAVSKEQTYRALSIVEDEWFNIPAAPVRDLFVPHSWLPDYLQRRNFNWRPVRAFGLPIRDGLPDREGVLPTWPRDLERELPADARDYYEVRYRGDDPILGREREWLTSEFAADIERIEEHARSRYGLHYKDAAPARALDVEE